MSGYTKMNGSPRYHAVKDRMAACLIGLCATLAAAPASAVDIPDVPLQSAVAVAPNIMFILDDSGSMQSEVMPSAMISDVTTRSNGQDWNPTVIGYLYKRGNEVYGDGDQYDNIVADPSNVYGYMLRSAHFNKIYFDPDISYIPWVRADGTSFGNASPACAPHNPGDADAGCRDLTINQNEETWWQRTSKDNTCKQSACVAEWASREYDPSVYYEYTGDASGAGKWDASNYTRHDVSSSQLQNFANWYTYYRSRILLSRAGIGLAFSELSSVDTPASPAARVGFAAINSDPTVIRGVRPFTGTARSTFFDTLYSHDIPAKGTPLRSALKDVGDYYKTAEPWRTDPTSSNSEMLTCRSSFSILMTDGYWNGSSDPAVANSDSTDGTKYTPASGGTAEGYVAKAPFKDDWSNTLADVAMHYWKTDLRDLANNVPTSPLNPAFWQHMVTYGVGLGVSGNQVAATAFAAISTGAEIAWGDPSGSGDKPEKIDDLLHAAVNSRGGFFSASNPTEFASGLSAVLNSINKKPASATAVEASSPILEEDTRLFASSYTPGEWTGEVTTYAVGQSGAQELPLWRTSATMATSEVGRNIFTKATGAGGATFPTDTQTLALTQGVADYIRGDRSKETDKPNGVYRERKNLLGDIVNSSPLYVPATDTVYVGANDGMLHAFDGTTGAELFAYVPAGIDLQDLKDFSSPAYSHHYFVDGPLATYTIPAVDSTPERHVLVGTLGRGGRGLFALDITDPDAFGNSDVLWDTTGGALQGEIIGEPFIAPLNDGNIGVIVGNGINSPSDTAASRSAALMIYDLDDGTLIKAIDTGVGGDNGLSAPRGWKSDGDADVDVVYAGDLHGNLWKFDLASSNTNSWAVAFTQGQNNLPLFTAVGPEGTQPITGGVTISTHPTTHERYLWFGTGSYLTSDDRGSTATQTMYGVIDSNTPLGSNRTDLLQRRTIAIEETKDGQVQRAFEHYDVLPDGKKGWFIDLLKPPFPPGTKQGERVVRTPIMRRTKLTFDSIIPSTDPCLGGGSGFRYALDAYTGTTLPGGGMDVDGNGNPGDDTIGSGDNETPVGGYSPGGGMPTGGDIISDGLGGEDNYSGGSEAGTPSEYGGLDPRNIGRISWRELIGE